MRPSTLGTSVNKVGSPRARKLLADFATFLEQMYQAGGPLVEKKKLDAGRVGLAIANQTSSCNSLL